MLGVMIWRYWALEKDCTMIEPNFNLKLIAVMLAGEAVFGVIYNRWVAEHQKANKGVYTAFYVVGGAFVTLLIATPVLGLAAAGMTFAAFIASGTPMILGSMKRHTARIADEDAKAKSIAKGALRRGQISES